MTKNESKLLSLQWIAKTSAVLFVAFRFFCKRGDGRSCFRRHG